MEDGLVKVRSVYSDGPAARSGIVAGDTITHIDDVSINGLTAGQVSSMLRGPAHTDVRLKIARKDQNDVVEIRLLRALLTASYAQLNVRAKDGALLVKAVGPLPVLDFESGKSNAVLPISSAEFYFNGGDYTRIAFVRDGSGSVSGAVLNPGPFEVRGLRKD